MFPEGEAVGVAGGVGKSCESISLVSDTDEVSEISSLLPVLAAATLSLSLLLVLPPSLAAAMMNRNAFRRSSPIDGHSLMACWFLYNYRSLSANKKPLYHKYYNILCGMTQKNVPWYDLCIHSTPGIQRRLVVYIWLVVTWLVDVTCCGEAVRIFSDGNSRNHVHQSDVMSLLRHNLKKEL